jgi:hypothetical protein
VNESPDVPGYCRAIETYLCQKNEGHLIRIVGPAFEQVSGWAARGVPLKVAFHGIDRYCERYYAKGPRRRPVRIEFCEADILDMFDDWRRAVGVASNGGTADAPDRKGSLASHLDRVIARLTALGGGREKSPEFANQLEAVARELDALRTEAQRARGDRRAEMIAILERMDRDLLSAAAGAVDPGRAESLRREAREELTPFTSRMSPDAYAAALDAAFARLLREAVGLPVVRYE